MTSSTFDTPEIRERVRGLKLLAFDFDGVFTDNSVYVDQDGRETVRCSRAEGFGLRKLEEVGIEPMVVSTEANPVVTARCDKLKIVCRQNAENKLEVFEGLLKERGVDFSQAGFVGNDINDLGCLERVALPMIVQDAHPDVLSVALYRTILPGGYGAVREICDLIFRMRTAG